MIGSVCVASNRPFIVYGPKRGLVSTHWTPSGAFRRLERYFREAGASDLEVYTINLATREWMACVSYGVCNPKEADKSGVTQEMRDALGTFPPRKL